MKYGIFIGVKLLSIFEANTLSWKSIYKPQTPDDDQCLKKHWKKLMTSIKFIYNTIKQYTYVFLTVWVEHATPTVVKRRKKKT